jgi:hypothetical protein
LAIIGLADISLQKTAETAGAAEGDLFAKRAGNPRRFAPRLMRPARQPSQAPA